MRDVMLPEKSAPFSGVNISPLSCYTANQIEDGVLMFSKNIHFSSLENCSTHLTLRSRVHYGDFFLQL